VLQTGVQSGAEAFAAESRRLLRRKLRRWLWVLGSAAGAGGLLLLYAAAEDRRLRARIEERLAALRAAGQPVTAADLGRLFPDPPPAEDAGALLRQSFARLTTPASANDLPIVGNVTLPAGTNRLTDRTVAALQQYMAASRPVFDALPAAWPDAARFPAGWSNGFAHTTPLPLVNVRRLMQTLILRALWHAEQGEAPAAVDSVVWTFRLSDALSRHGTLVNHMIGRVGDDLACAALERVLNHTTLTGPQIDALRVAIRPRLAASMAQTVAIERCHTIWALEAARDHRDVEAVFGAKAVSWKYRLRRLCGLAPPLYRAEDHLEYLHLMAALQAATSQSPPQGYQRGEQLPATNNWKGRSLALQYVQPNWAKALRADAEHVARLTVADAALAVERYRLAHNGAVPASLADAAPGVSLDPFTGQPLPFMPRPRGYLLYSVGPDRRDDGGRPKPDKAPASNRYDLPLLVER
jgi:hypothetical protein